MKRFLFMAAALLILSACDNTKMQLRAPAAEQTAANTSVAKTDTVKADTVNVDTGSTAVKR
ncbi:hypothetical protein [Pedobacter heparinus]|uniref:hypothetical protein n=1 Tax=Pedobacter heparinus TaxID=984 RepID=UPI00292F0221|nr:hypothetical protein [Pedobacter heparinus]